MIIPEMVQEIQELLEQETVECPECGGRGTYVSGVVNIAIKPRAKLDNCPTCGGTGQVPDPACDPLREVVRKERVLVVGRGLRQAGYIPRSWADKPDWFLATLLVRAAIVAGLAIRSDTPHILFSDPSKAGKAVIEALSAQRTPGAEKEQK